MTYISLLFLMLSSCNSDTTIKNFEGTVSFDIEYKDINTNLTKEYLLKTYGNKMTYYHSSGGYFKKFTYQNKEVQSRWYDTSDNLLYGHLNSMDTLFYYSPVNEGFEIQITESDIIENIAGHDCKKYTVIATPLEEKNLPKFRYEFFITTNIGIDTEPYKGFTEGGYSELLNKSGGLILKQVYYGQYYTRIRTANKVEQTSVKLDSMIKTEGLIKEKL